MNKMNKTMCLSISLKPVFTTARPKLRTNSFNADRSFQLQLLRVLFDVL